MWDRLCCELCFVETLISKLCTYTVAVSFWACFQIGASQGLEGLRPFAPEWAPVFEAVQGEWLLTFIRSLLRPPSGGQDIAALFAPRIIEAIARLWLSPEVTGKKAADEALLLLAELCEQVKPLVSRPSLTRKVQA